MTRCSVLAEIFVTLRTLLESHVVSNLSYVNVWGCCEPAYIRIRTGEEPGLDCGHVELDNQPYYGWPPL